MPKPVTILIGALGGDGGGVLCDWIVAAAQSQGLGVQATQIPGVAQRTGATTYYLEVMPSRAGASVLALNPAIGEVDVALATELLEAGRMIFNGFVTPERTTLIASTHRVLAIGERMAMGDGSFDVGRLLRAVKERSKAQILFDMDQAAEESGGVINAVLLGALAGSGRLPIPDAAFEAAIRHAGKSVDTNLAAFAFGRGHARGELEQAVREHRKRQAAASGVEDLIERARSDFPAASLDMVEEGIRRLAAYQDRKYAALYLDRLTGLPADLVREVARHLAVRMSFEDVIRVAQAKTSRERLERVRKEVRAREHEPLEITEHFKPGNEEIAAMLPPAGGTLAAQAAAVPHLHACAQHDRVGLRAAAAAGRPALVAAAFLPLRRGAGRDRTLARLDPRRRAHRHRPGARDRGVGPPDQGLWRHLQARPAELPAHRRRGDRARARPAAWSRAPPPMPSPTRAWRRWPIPTASRCRGHWPPSPRRRQPLRSAAE